MTGQHCPTPSKIKRKEKLFLVHQACPNDITGTPPGEKVKTGPARFTEKKLCNPFQYNGGF